MRSLSDPDLNATPPFDYAHDHFGFRDRLSRPVMKGSGEAPTPGSGDPLEPGEFILGYDDENGPVVDLPQPEVLSRNGSYLAYRRLEEHVGVFRDYLQDNADTPEGQELLAARFMGRWRSGAPLVPAPDKDDAELGADPVRNNDFNYKEEDPFGYACPLGAHARRLNPRDTAHYLNRRRMIRRGATYGPALPEGEPDDGVDRGIAAFIICADLVRQFEFAQNVWINDKAFHELGNEHDPEGAQRTSALHHDEGRCLLLPAGHRRHPLPGVAGELTARQPALGGAAGFASGCSGTLTVASVTDGRREPTTGKGSLVGRSGPEEAAEGVIEGIKGKVKALVGALIGRDDLFRTGEMSV